jgi:hypothetical protein
MQTLFVLVDPCVSTINLKLLLQGYYVGSGLTNPALFNQNRSTDNTIADSISVDVRSATPSYTTVATVNTVLGKNGIVNCNFSGVSGNYYLVVRQRNHVEIWSTNPILLRNNLS